MSGVSSSIFASASAVIQLLVVASVGTISARYPKAAPLLPPPVLRSLSQVSARYLIPCFIVHTVGSATDAKLLASSGLLIVAGIISIIASALFMLGWGRIAIPMAQRESSLWRVASVASSYGNIVAMPLVIINTLCQMDEVNEEFKGDADKCFEAGGALIL